MIIKKFWNLIFHLKVTYLIESIYLLGSVNA